MRRTNPPRGNAESEESMNTVLKSIHALISRSNVTQQSGLIQRWGTMVFFIMVKLITLLPLRFSGDQITCAAAVELVSSSVDYDVVMTWLKLWGISSQLLKKNVQLAVRGTNMTWSFWKCLQIQRMISGSKFTCLCGEFGKWIKNAIEFQVKLNVNVNDFLTQ